MKTEWPSAPDLLLGKYWYIFYALFTAACVIPYSYLGHVERDSIRAYLYVMIPMVVYSFKTLPMDKNTNHGYIAVISIICIWGSYFFFAARYQFCSPTIKQFAALMFNIGLVLDGYVFLLTRDALRKGK